MCDDVHLCFGLNTKVIKNVIILKIQITVIVTFIQK